VLPPGHVECSRVAPALWQGSAPRCGLDVPFDLVVLCAEEYQAEDVARPFGARARVMRVPLDDSHEPSDVSPERVWLAFAAARAVAQCYRRGGSRILVTCMQGRNRSGLVVALTLVELGFQAKDAVAAVRQARGPRALSNPWFVKLLHEASGRRFLRFDVPVGVSP
jgi:protein-tyrosine phosphatase